MLKKIPVTKIVQLRREGKSLSLYFVLDLAKNQQGEVLLTRFLYGSTDGDLIVFERYSFEDPEAFVKRRVQGPHELAEIFREFGTELSMFKYFASMFLWLLCSVVLVATGLVQQLLKGRWGKDAG